MTYGGKTLIGIVGYTPVVELFPLGTQLMSALSEHFHDDASVVVENMTWGPMHIVQRFQEEGTVRPDRLVLVGAASICRRPGQVRITRWRGGHLPDAEVQDRIYEAVTGIVDLENTLIIGDYFQVWPDECFTVEADLQPDTFGRMVVAETQLDADQRQLEQELGFSPQGTTDAIAEAAIEIATHGTQTRVDVGEKSVGSLAPFDGFTINHVVAEPTRPDTSTKDRNQ